MDTLGDRVPVARAVVLRNDDAAARGEADEEADKQVHELSGRTADRGEGGIGADKAADNHGIYGIVELLEKSTEQNRKEEQ